MSKNGNIYPHLPLVTSELNGPPWKDVPIGTVAEFITGGDKTYLNGTADQLAALGIEISSSTDDQDYPGCVDKWVLLPECLAICSLGHLPSLTDTLTNISPNCPEQRKPARSQGWNRFDHLGSGPQLSLPIRLHQLRLLLALRPRRPDHRHSTKHEDHNHQAHQAHHFLKHDDHHIPTGKLHLRQGHLLLPPRRVLGLRHRRQRPLRHTQTPRQRQKRHRPDGQ